MKKQDVIMYTLPLCPYCARAKQYLRRKGIAFAERNILMPKHLKELYKATAILRVPVTLVGERILVRFSAAEYEEVFGDD